MKPFFVPLDASYLYGTKDSYTELVYVPLDEIKNVIPVADQDFNFYVHYKSGGAPLIIIEKTENNINFYKKYLT